MKTLPGKPLICLITKGDADPTNFSRKKKEILGLVALACDVGLSIIQIREKQLSARALYQLVSEAVAITRRTDTVLLVNDRSDIALAAGADGVHLPSNSLSADVIRAAFPVRFIVGVSAHSLDEAVSAKEMGADLVMFGPVFSTPGKQEPVGLAELDRVAKRVDAFPVIAVGGINETNLGQVLETHASGFAAIRYLNDEKNLRDLRSVTSQTK